MYNECCMTVLSIRLPIYRVGYVSILIFFDLLDKVSQLFFDLALLLLGGMSDTADVGHLRYQLRRH